MPDPRPPETGRRFRRAAALLLHWHDHSGVTAQGVVEILNEAGIGADGGDWQEQAGFVCALAELAWQMARTPDQEAAVAYLRVVTARAALDEVQEVPGA